MELAYDFSPENVTPALEAYKLYLLDKNSIIIVRVKGEVVAYVTILSLKETVYNKVKFNKMNESEIKFEDLELNKEKYFRYLYFSTIAINKNNRNIVILKKLLNATKARILNIIGNGCNILEVMTDCSTNEGEKISQRFLKLKPFKQTSHNSTIHILNGNEFVENFLKCYN